MSTSATSDRMAARLSRHVSFRRRCLIASGLFGVLLVAVPAPGFFALVTDHVVSEDNSIETGEYAAPDKPPSDPDIQAARPVSKGNDQTCSGPDVVWSDVAIPATFDSAVQVEPSPPRRVYDGSFICVRRVDTSSSPVDIDLAVAALVETDPTCASGESEVDSDCATTEAGSGEVSEYFSWSVSVSSRSDAVCERSTETGWAPLQEGSRLAVTRMSPAPSAPICVGTRLSSEIPDGDPGLRRVATDAATWDWIIGGSPG